MSDLKYPVISISREYAAYGRTIARALALELGIPFFDKDFVKETAKKSGYTEEEVQAEGETISQGSKILNSILNNAMSYTSSHDEIFKAEAEVILELAQRPCIIVGRCSEAILRTAEIPSLNVFLHASIEDRIMHAAELPENKGRDVKHEIVKWDKQRANFFKNYTGQEFGDYHNYDLVLDVGRLGVDKCVEIILEAEKLGE